MEESALLGTKPLVDSLRHFIRDQSGIFSVCHLCECRIVQWRHDSHLSLLLNWFLASRLFNLHIIKRTLHGGSKIWILCSRGGNNISLVRCAHLWDIVLAFEHRIHIFSPPCSILYICFEMSLWGKKGFWRAQCSFQSSPWWFIDYCRHHITWSKG